jgi:hypothetical protein
LPRRKKKKVYKNIVLKNVKSFEDCPRTLPFVLKEGQVVEGLFAMLMMLFAQQSKKAKISLGAMLQ